MTPLPLPRFTFLFGRPDQGQYPLASAIVSQSHGTAVLDLEEPLRDAAHVVAFNGTEVFVDGQLGADRSEVDLTGREVTVDLNLHAGDATATIWTNDLTYDYVKENAEYST